MTKPKPTLAETVKWLLYHRLGRYPLHPDLVVVPSEYDTYAVAVIIDGWYTDPDVAREVLRLRWRHDLNRVIKALEREQASQADPDSPA